MAKTRKSISHDGSTAPQPPPLYRVKTLTIQKLWGYKNFKLNFDPHVTILTGENASGKTTVLNVLRFLATGQLSRLIDIPFLSATLKLSSFNSDETVSVSAQLEPGKLHLTVPGTTYHFNAEFPAGESHTRVIRHGAAHQIGYDFPEYESLISRIPAV